jgi:hypothetical protein
MAVERLTRGPHTVADFPDKNNTRKPDSAREKKIENDEKSGKIVGVGNLIWNNFHHCIFFQIFTDF